MVHHYRDLIKCIVCKRIFPTESGTMLLPVTRERVCLTCIEMMYDRWGHDL